LLIGSSTVVNGLLQESLRPRLLRDIVPVAGLTASAFVILMSAGAPQTNLADLIAYAKANPGKLRVGSYGIGTQSHLATELLKQKTGIDVTHVPFRGGAPLITNLIGKHIDVGFDTVGNALSHIRSGTLRALAVTTSTRLIDALPDIPTAAETVPGYEAIVWTGIAVRNGTPSDIVERLNSEFNVGLEAPNIRSRIENLAITPAAFSPKDFAAFWASEIETTLNLIRTLNIRLE
jgi:tripartite-type tricarboxylate transporter receptor subunit TctC